MKASRIIKLIGTLGVISACMLLVVGCSTDNNNNNNTEESSGAVAATVNGAEIPEDTVTKYIENLRTSQGLETEDAWGEWLSSAEYTPESVRQEVIDMHVRRELIRQAATENEIIVEASEVDGYVNEIKSNYNSEEAWQQALTQVNTTESEYREIIELALMQQRLQEVVIEATEPTDEELLEAVQSNVAQYDGAKRSSHILFSVDDEATAREVLEKVKSGELDFAEAAAEYSSDGSASNGGDVGWDKLNSFVTPYTDAVNALGLNEISDLVESEYGYHIIKVTEVFSAPAEITDINQVPEAIVEEIKSSLTTDKTEAFDAWLEEYKEGAEIVTNPMPDDVSYNIDMTRFQAEDGEGEVADVEGLEDVTAIDAPEGEEAETTPEPTSDGEEDEANGEGDPASDDAAN